MTTENGCHLCGDPAHISDRDGYWCQAHWDEAQAAKRAEEKRVTEEAGGPWPQTCPRRYEPFQQGGAEHQDTWDLREQMHKGLRARHCSYCGSLHPDDFMRLVGEGWVVGPTDKSYKAYLSMPVSPEAIEEKHQAFLTSERARVLVQNTKGHHPEMTDDEVQAELDRWWQDQELPLAGGSGHETKFYFQHLSEDQMREFVERINDKTMKIGYPGHFYSRPFFVAPA